MAIEIKLCRVRFKNKLRNKLRTHKTLTETQPILLQW